jgi:Bardet-Biedl syndrome 9 protein
VEWSLNLGEPCRDILLGNFSVDVESVGNGSAPTQANELLMVCEKSVFLVKAETGGVIQQRRLDRSDASCCCTVPYIHPDAVQQPQNPPNYNFLVAGHDGTVQVFSGFHLVWAARLTFTPVHMEVSTFGGTKGLIVAVDDGGMLTVNYLGTKPPVTAVLTQVRDLDYDKIDEEHRQLLQIIRDSQNENKGENLDKLLIKSQIPKTLDMEPTSLPDLPINTFVPVHPPNTTLHHDGQYIKLCVRFFFSHNGERPLQNVSVSLSSPQHIFISPRQFVIPKVTNLKSTPVVQKVTFYALKNFLPTSMEVVLTASYQSNNKGEPQIVAHHVSLPLCMALRPKAPSKNAAYKVIVDTEYPAIPLTELFGDVLYAYQQAGYLDNIQESIGSNAVQAMGFQFFCNPTNSLGGTSNSPNSSNLVSILVSKNAGRYRLQADSYELLALMMQELGQRLQNRINAQNQTSLPLSSVVKYNDVLPIDEYFAVIHTHLICRLRLQNFNAQLNDAAHQYRLIEKRLLVRFKDRNPTPLHGLDLILKESYDRIIQLADEIQAQQQKLKGLNNEIECFSRLMANLICIKYTLSIADFSALQAYLCPDIQDGIDQVMISIVFILLFF